MRRLLLLLLSAAWMAPASAQVRDPSDYQRVLLPFQAPVPAFRGTWQVSWWLRNDGLLPVDVFPLACLVLPPPANFAITITERPALPAQATPACYAGDALPTFLIPPSVPVRESIGAFLYVEKDATQLAIAGSLAWEAGTDRAEPAPLQAIPEAAFRSGTGSVLPVPVAQDTRYALRVYALPETLDVRRVTVRIFEMQPQLEPDPRERPIAEIHGELRPQTGVLAPCFGACQVPDVPLAPAIYQRFDLPVPPRGDVFQSPMRIEIAPGSPEIRWWAVVSATDNRTQQVRLFQPSH